MKYTNSLTPQSRVLLDKLSVAQLVKKLSAVIEPISPSPESNEYSPSTSTRLTSILPSHLRRGFPSYLFLSFFITMLCTHVSAPLVCYMPSPSYPPLIWSSEYFMNYGILSSLVTSRILGPHIHTSSLLKLPCLCSSLNLTKFYAHSKQRVIFSFWTD